MREIVDRRKESAFDEALAQSGLSRWFWAVAGRGRNCEKMHSH